MVLVYQNNVFVFRFGCILCLLWMLINGELLERSYLDIVTASCFIDMHGCAFLVGVGHMTIDFYVLYC